MRGKDAFGGYHPLVNFLYFGIIFAFAMLSMHPVCLLISFVSSAYYYISLKGSKAVGLLLKAVLPLMLFTMIINPLFSHRGLTLIRYLPSGNPLTLESIIYGIAAGVMLTSILLWFACFSEVITSDKFVYLFGRIVPALSLLLSMTLRFVPRFKAQFDSVRESQRLLGRDTLDGGAIRRVRNAIVCFSVVVTWSMENAIDTADSMKSRGYGTKRRTAYSIYRFEERDVAVLAFLMLAGFSLLSGGLAGKLSFRYFPSIRGVINDKITIYLMIVFFCIMFIACNDRPLGGAAVETFKIEDLTFTYPERTRPAIENVSFIVRKGDFFVLCGHSGCGKSTLLRQLKPSIAPHGSLSGRIEFDGKLLTKLGQAEAAARIGFVLQSPESQIVTDKVWHELAFGLESLGCDSITIRRRCAEMAAFFGIENWYYKNVSELSGGQKQLLCLASVMTMQPEVLILDEPTAQLDPIAASEFLSMLGRINRELGVTVLISEHRLEEALTLANRAAIMENGHILCCGSVDELGKYLKANDNSMLAAMPCAMRVWGSVESLTECPVTVNDGRNFLNNYLQKHEKHPLLRASHMATSPSADEAVLGNGSAHEEHAKVEIQNAWFRYERELPDIIRGLQLTANEGEILCILGGNGSGKTTTLKLIGGIKRVYRGKVRVNGRVGMLPQDPQTVFVKKTVYEDLSDVLKLQGIPKSMRGDEIAKISALCGISELLDKHPYDLSGGEQQRAALAKVLLLKPDILLLDEPTKGLDVPFKEKLAGILSKLKYDGCCIIMVSHDIEFCAKYADRCGLFFDGGIVTMSEPEKFFAGNSFYTTAANRMAREFEPRAVTSEDVISVIGGRLHKRDVIAQPVLELRHPAEPAAPAFIKPEVKKLPLWRKVCAAVSALLAFGVYIYISKTEKLTEFIDGGGATALGRDQLILYGIIIALLVITAVLLGKRSKPPVKARTPVEKRKLGRRTVTAAALILLMIPVTLFIGLVYLNRKQYYITALAVLIECMLPFFLVFEGRRPKARELVIIATLCAMAIAGRAAFFMLPQFKPVMALAIIAGVAFGGETGFLVGAVTMLVSNILFSQGPWTPWQMFAMGIIGFLAGVLYRKGLLMRTRTSLCVFGAICTFLIYGGIMNPASALIWGSETLNWNIILGYYITGFPMDAVHAVSTALFLWFGAEPMLEKLDRVKVKYDLY